MCFQMTKVLKEKRFLRTLIYFPKDLRFVDQLSEGRILQMLS